MKAELEEAKNGAEEARKQAANSKEIFLRQGQQEGYELGKQQGYDLGKNEGIEGFLASAKFAR